MEGKKELATKPETRFTRNAGHKISDIIEKVYTKREFDWLRDETKKIK